jgi:hypothetical protein
MDEMKALLVRLIGENPAYNRPPVDRRDHSPVYVRKPSRHNHPPRHRDGERYYENDRREYSPEQRRDQSDYRERYSPGEKGRRY